MKKNSFASLLDKEDALDDFKTVDGNENGRVTWYEYLTHLHTTEKDINALQAKKNRTEMEETLLKVCVGKVGWPKREAILKTN